ncbi:uncharacterized protein LOC121857200 isoform X2 [Homarus americanus]|uniref:uncharacterized protein LOC121857200 isoform X2 n=1 Tax=Homarus americanus TaxID=6706 RepID=UPI001C468553|nr:uncharacterized protein LOC121857200 isoform X2 [Homarus americanus]
MVRCTTTISSPEDNDVECPWNSRHKPINTIMTKTLATAAGDASNTAASTNISTRRANVQRGGGKRTSTEDQSARGTLGEMSSNKLQVHVDSDKCSLTIDMDSTTQERGAYVNFVCPQIETSKIIMYAPKDSVSCNSTHKIIPSRNQIKECLANMTALKNQTNLEHAAVLEFGIFDSYDLSQCLDVHKKIETKKAVLEEINWIEPDLLIDSQNKVCPGRIKEFKNLIHGYRSVDFIRKYEDILTEDLATLTCDRDITDGVISNFCHILGKQVGQKIYYINASYITHTQQMANKIINHFRQQRLSIADIKICFVVHMGKFPFPDCSETFIGQLEVNGSVYTAEHFSFAYYSTETNEVIYADSLGWPAPATFLNMAKELALHINNDVDTPTLRYIHNPASVGENVAHECDHQCCKDYPLQSCSSACGIAVIIGLSLISLDSEYFQKLLAQENIPELQYLSNISQFSRYLRHILMDWFVSGRIDVNMLYLTEIKTVRTIDDTNEYEHSTVIYETKPVNRMSFSDYGNDGEDYEEIQYKFKEENSVHSANYGTVHAATSNTNFASKIKMTRSMRKCNSRSKYNVDTSHLRPYVSGYPTVSFKQQRKTYILECIRAHDGHRVSKSFKTIPQLEEFIHSANCYDWLQKEEEYSTQVNFPFPYNVDALVTKPSISFIKPNKLRLTCIPKVGKPKIKMFKCSPAGREDGAAMEKIKKFLGDFINFSSWLNDWILIDEVMTGIETRRYLDHMLQFDYTQTVSISPEVKPYLIIHRDPNCPSVSVVSNPNWGTTHRSDDTFSLRPDAPSDLLNNSQQILHVTFTCSSRTDCCKTKCGELLNKVRIENGIFSCCNEVVPSEKECFHCKAQTSSKQWYKFDDQQFLCKVCYNYYSQKKTHRPLIGIPTTKPFYEHNQCQFKIRLELKPDFNGWLVYKHVNNDDAHENAQVLGVRRFTLTERDCVDKMRSSSSKITAKQLTVSTMNENSNIHQHSIGQYRRRCKTVDSHLVNKGILQCTSEEIPDAVNNILSYSAESCMDTGDELDHIQIVHDASSHVRSVPPGRKAKKIPRTVTFRREGGPMNSNELIPTQKTTESEVFYNFEGGIKNQTSAVQLHSAATSSTPLICFKCVETGKDKPYSCLQESELQSHVTRCHKENVFCCPHCYKDNLIEGFPNLKSLRIHIKNRHCEYTNFKKIQPVTSCVNTLADENLETSKKKRKIVSN